MSCKHTYDETGHCFECSEPSPNRCIRCGCNLESDIAIQTGICPECWDESDEEDGD